MGADVDILTQLAGFSVADQAPRLDPALRAKLALHLADTLAALVAGRHAGIVPTPVPPDEDAPPLIDRIAFLSASVRSTEADDIYPAGCVTSSSAVVPAALGLLPSGGGSAQLLADALAVGHEAMIGFAEAIHGPFVLAEGIWPSCAAAPLAAAAVASRCLALTPERARHALAIALAMTGGRMVPPGGAPSFRWLAFGQAVRSGLFAGLAAQAGYAGNPDTALGPWMERWFGRAPDLERLRPAPGGGLRFRSASLKPFCAAKQVTAAIHGFRRILSAGLDPAAIREVLVAVPSFYERMLTQPVRSEDRLTTITSASYQLALAALAPDDLLDIGREQVRVDAVFRDLAGCIRVVADPELDLYYPQAFPARVTVTSADRTLTETIVAAPGDAQVPLTEEEVRAKALRLMSPAIGADAARVWFTEALAALEDDRAAEATQGRVLALGGSGAAWAARGASGRGA